MSLARSGLRNERYVTVVLSVLLAASVGFTLSGCASSGDTREQLQDSTASVSQQVDLATAAFQGRTLTSQAVDDVASGQDDVAFGQDGSAANGSATNGSAANGSAAKGSVLDDALANVAEIDSQVSQLPTANPADRRVQSDVVEVIRQGGAAIIGARATLAGSPGAETPAAVLAHLTAASAALKSLTERLETDQ